MEPTSLPDNWKEELRTGGWLTDPKALCTLLTLGGAVEGDELLAVPSVPGRAIDIHIARVGNNYSEEFVREEYGNAQLANKHWKILGWRRPKRG